MKSPHPHARRPYLWLLPVLTVVVIVVVAVGWLSEAPRDLDLVRLDQTGTLRDDASSISRPVPSTGREATAPAATFGSVAEPAIVKELETITGALDGHELIGRRVDLRVPVRTAGAGQTAFWVGSGDNRLLVVLARDIRGAQERAHGAAVPHGIRPVNGRAASITGTIQQVPDAEERFSWRLTREEEEELLQRNVYIRAERVVADGHGE